jgi:hypothetical protein
LAEDLVIWRWHNNYDVFDSLLKNKEDGIATVDGKLPILRQFRLNQAGEMESLTVSFEGGLDPGQMVF